MKRYILMIMCCVATMMTYAQYGECIEVNEFSPTISRWGESHDPTQPERFECWEVDLGVQAHAKITYIVNLENVAYYDYVHIYEIDENGNAIHLRSFFGCTESGSIVTNSTTGKIRIEYLLVLGDCNDTFDGFRIHIEQATCCDLVNHDHYILGKLGIGTTQPEEMLHVNGALKLTSAFGNLTLGKMDANYVNLNTDLSGFSFNKPLYLQNSVIRNKARAFVFYTNTNTHCVTMLDNRVGIGTQNPRSSLDVNGSIRAKEILVETTGADFVFADDYQLRPLSEVEAFITENKHLPEIQSAQEMQENGVSVSELQTKLLQKIEELTLYILQQEEKIRQQDLRIKALEAK